MRDELLGEIISRNPTRARIVIAAWAADYDTGRPPSALGCQTPADIGRSLTTATARPGSREMKAPRGGRLLNPR